MALVIIRQDDKIENWKNALLAQAPALEVYSYLEDHPKDRVTMALVWKHPEGSLTELESILSSKTLLRPGSFRSPGLSTLFWPVICQNL